MRTMEAPNASRSSYKFVLPLIFLVIVGGIASPFLIARLKHSQLTANETATLALIRDYSKAQEEKFKANGAYATKFDDLGLSVKLPELDDPKAPPLNGYRFRILTESIEGTWLDKEGRLVKSYGVLAVPADYMVTGRDTFLTHGTEIFCVDFDVRTAQITRELRSFGLPPSAQKVE